jgi:serine/threonine protein kinase
MLLSMTEDTQTTRSMNWDDASRSAMAPGTVLRQRYRLDSEIGRGGMGVVYRATDLELMREVAVKVVSEAASSDARQRLIREARAAAALNHPHIISVHDIGEAEGMPFFVMELVDGPTLAKAPPSGLPRIVEIACQRRSFNYRFATRPRACSATACVAAGSSARARSRHPASPGKESGGAIRDSG